MSNFGVALSGCVVFITAAGVAWAAGCHPLTAAGMLAGAPLTLALCRRP